MSIENIIPEPKQYFLDLLIKLNFEVADAVFRYRNFQLAINGMAEILTLTCSAETEDMKKIAPRIYEAQKQQNVTIDDIVPIFANLQQHLMNKWFSELKLGLIQTSTIPGTREAPTQKVFAPNRTSQI